ncbi:MAG: TIGR00255 family protein [candidate division TM6 bacterium GW2011_GWF2_32_72]|nr:MAG: TIGR00255 family protein [candidate division TM6 bacterium GW2011_GWF2_32_72]
MLLSMTGFASTDFTLELPNGSRANGTISLKTLNSKFFECNCRIPQSISQLETEIISLLKKDLKRGYTSLVIHLDNPNILKCKITPALSTIQGYIDAINEIKNKTNINGDLTVSDLFKIQNIFVAAEEPLDEECKQQLFKAISETVTMVQKARALEGDALKIDLETRLTKLTEHAKQAQALTKSLIESKRKEFEDATSLDQSEELLETKKSILLALLDKIDTHEESIRFDSHLKTLKSVLTSAIEEKGKKIDFILQELTRETNTMAAKCSDAEISKLAIDIKVELEKMREQTQNIV